MQLMGVSLRRRIEPMRASAPSGSASPNRSWRFDSWAASADAVSTTTTRPSSCREFTGGHSCSRDTGPGSAGRVDLPQCLVNLIADARVTVAAAGKQGVPGGLGGGGHVAEAGGRVGASVGLLVVLEQGLQ